MGIIKESVQCTTCTGVGSRTYVNRDGQTIVENPCLICDGDGRVDYLSGLDDTLIQSIIATQAAHTAELNYIHGKVKKIWNKVKDGEPEE